MNKSKCSYTEKEFYNFFIYSPISGCLFHIYVLTCLYLYFTGLVDIEVDDIYITNIFTLLLLPPDFICNTLAIQKLLVLKLLHNLEFSILIKVFSTFMFYMDFSGFFYKSIFSLYFTSTSQFLKIFIYLAAPGLACGRQNLQLQHANSW